MVKPEIEKALMEMSLADLYAMLKYTEAKWNYYLKEAKSPIDPEDLSSERAAEQAEFHQNRFLDIYEVIGFKIHLTMNPK